MKVISHSNQLILVEHLIIARSFFRRLQGLLGTTCLPWGEGLLIQPCNSIHTFFMRYPIDVLFLDSTFTVVKVAENMVPGRMMAAGKSSSVLELPAGTVLTAGIIVGDQLHITNE